MALDDMFQLVHNQTLFGKKLNNVYHAIRTNSGESAQQVADSFVATIINDIRLYQNNEVANIDVVAFSLGDPEDFFTQDLAGLAGFRDGLNSPSFVSGAIRFPSLNRLIRSGHKRFAGALESDYDDGALGAGATVLLEDIGDVLIGDWLASSDSHHVANFVIIKRVCDEIEPVTEKCLQYRLPESEAELKFYQPTVRLVKADITSQVSRKTF